jgi:hypothetical protein
MRVLTFFIFCCFSALSCKPASTAETTTAETPDSETKILEDKVMAIHDELMAKMTDITKIEAQLRAIKATVKETPEGKMESPDGLEQVMGSLKLAEQGMWDWMKSYSDTKPTVTPDQLKSFYEKQLETINKIKEDMLSSIEKGQAWIAGYEKK